MSYVRCIKNNAYIQFPDQPFNENETTTLTVGKVYKAVPPTEEDLAVGELRVFDDTAEDYLFPASYFEPYLHTVDSESSVAVTIHLTTYQRNILHAEALAARKSVSGLMREIVDERLDLPE